MLKIKPFFSIAFLVSGLIILGGFIHTANADNVKDSAEWLEKASSLFKTAKFQESLEASDKAIALNPQSSSAFSLRGLVYERMGKKDQAIGDFTKAIELNPNDFEAY